MENKLLFAQNARVAVIGDSITHNGLYVEYLQDYYRSFLPDRQVRLYNLGIGGDAAAHSLARIDDMLSVAPTEAIVGFCGNDLGLHYYSAAPSAEDITRREDCRHRHLEGMITLIERLLESGIPVTLASPVGRDEHTAGKEGNCSVGATDALFAMYKKDIAALEGRLKNTADLLTPIQALQAELVARGGPSLFRVDRSHLTDLGLAIMARALLRAQELPVSIPTATDILSGWREHPLPEVLLRRREAGLRWRDLTWVYPHQKDRTRDMGLAERIAFWQEELKREDLPGYFVSMYTNYVKNAENEPDYIAEYMAIGDNLYKNVSASGSDDFLRI